MPYAYRALMSPPPRPDAATRRKGDISRDRPTAPPLKQPKPKRQHTDRPEVQEAMSEAEEMIELPGGDMVSSTTLRP